MTKLHSKGAYTMLSQNSGVRLKIWLIGILSFLLASVFFVNSFVAGQLRLTHLMNTTAFKRSNIPEDSVSSLPQKIPGYLVHSGGCRIPDIDPLDPFSRNFMVTPDPLICKDEHRGPLVISNNTAVYVNPGARNNYYNASETPKCYWMSLMRVPGHDNQFKYSNDWNYFEESSIVDAEFVRVECYRDKNQIYRDYHAFVHRKEKTEKRCANFVSTNKNKLSLLFIGLDAVSRLNFHRQMPKTVLSLRRLDAIELLGYHKVGENTYPNLVTVLTGFSAEEIRTICLPNATATFDDCPFVWKNFSEIGYRTIFAEDAYQITTFNYLKAGFRDEPTDYYIRPYCVAMERDISNSYKAMRNVCVGVRKNFENLLEYAGRVAREFVSDRYFAFTWQASLTHDDMNYASLADDGYSKFIQRLNDDKLLENTLLIVMSDHGIRWGSYRETPPGRMEDSLPFVFFVFPDWWKRMYSAALANLRNNVYRLTTPFDLHETILDIMKMNDMNEKGMLKRNNDINDGNYGRGVSLFSPIPNNRNCSMAGIPANWCICHTSSNVSLDDKRVQSAADFLINELNGLLKNYRQCSRLRLKSIRDAKLWVDHADEKEKKRSTLDDFTITVETEPGNAMFEASVKHDNTSNRLVGTINRINAYGNQSTCVNDYKMRLYCYCR